MESTTDSLRYKPPCRMSHTGSIKTGKTFIDPSITLTDHSMDVNGILADGSLISVKVRYQLICQCHQKDISDSKQNIS